MARPALLPRRGPAMLWAMGLSSVRTVLGDPGSSLGRLASRTAELRALDRQVSPFIPAALRDHVHATQLERSTLTLTVSDPARASRVRLLGPTLARALRDGPGLAVKRVKVRVMRHPSAPPAPSSPHRRGRTPLSADSARLLRDLAGDADDPLARALRRLASRALD